MLVADELAGHVWTHMAARRTPDQDARLTHCLADWLGVALAGTRSPPAQRAAQYAKQWEPGRSATLLCGGKSSLRAAVLANAIAGHVLDYDDTHLGYWGHPSATIVPVVLALAERRSTSGHAVLTAVDAGIEVARRMGEQMGKSHRQAGWHATATLGSFGAATAATIMLGGSSHALRTALSLCATQASGLSAAFGTDGKPFQVAHAAAAGLEAALLAQAGLNAAPDLLEKRGGFFDTYAGAPVANEAAADRASDGIMFKFVPACFGTQAASEAAWRLYQRLGDRIAHTRSIDIQIPQSFIGICDRPAPRDVSEARFSVALVVALRLVGAELADPKSFDREVQDNAAAWALTPRVTVRGAALADSAAIVTLEIDGQTTYEHVDLAQGDVSLDAERARVAEKFARLSDPILGRGPTSKLWSIIETMRDAPDAAAWVRPLRRAHH